MGYAEPMGLKDVFSRKEKPGEGPELGSVVAETTYIRARGAGDYLLAEVLCEKYSEHEASAIQTDILAAAKDFGSKVVIDMTHVQMLASAGIGSLIQVHQACAGAGGKMVLCNIDENIRMMLGVARMDRMFTLATDHADAAGKIG